MGPVESQSASLNDASQLQNSGPNKISLEKIFMHKYFWNSAESERNEE